MKAKIVGVVLFAMLISSFAADEEKKPADEQDLNAIKARFDKEAAPYFSGEKNTTLMKAGGGGVAVSPYTLLPVLEGIIMYKGEMFKSANPELIAADAMIGDMMKKAKEAEEELNTCIKTIADSKAKIAGFERDVSDNQDKMMKEKDKEEKGKYNKMIFQAKNDASDAKKEMKKQEKDIDKKKQAAAEALKKANALKAVVDAYIANQKKLGGGFKKADDAPGVKKEGNLDPFAPKQ